VPSSSSDDDRGSRRKDRKRRKRRRDQERYDGAAASRKPGVRAWAGSETKLVKDYYFDAKGDQDNLAFGSIYRSGVCLANAVCRYDVCNGVLHIEAVVLKSWLPF
jgi:hypothetical protein